MLRMRSSERPRCEGTPTVGCGLEALDEEVGLFVSGEGLTRYVRRFLRLYRQLGRRRRPFAGYLS